jgi:hypothetical protein
MARWWYNCGRVFGRLWVTVNCTLMTDERKEVVERTQEALTCTRVADGLEDGSVAVDGGREGGEREEGGVSIHRCV